MTIKQMAILTDVTKCIGCNKCVSACQAHNKLPRERMWRWLKSIDDLSSSRWTTLRRLSDDRFVRRQCRHCLDPECVSVCIVGALKKTEEGAVIYDKDICIGCRYCMIACPWEIPRYSWEDTVPYVQKCDMCYERVTQQGLEPACVAACPTGATIFGERDELLAEARRRIEAEPDRYVHKIYGEQEVGGESVLYLSDVELNLTDLDEPVVDTAPMPHRTTKILHQMPLTFVAMASAMGGLHWIIGRRQKLMSRSGEADESARDSAVEEAQEPTSEPAPDETEQETQSGKADG